MASYAGGYGAGGAVDALKDLIAQRFMERRQAEAERATRAEETFRQSEMAAAQEREARREAIAREDATERTRQFEVSNKQHQDDLRERRIDRSMDEQKRAMERADDAAAGLEGEDRAAKRRAEERQADRNFQIYMDNRRAARERSGGGNEPLVAIADPQTGQPKLVPRSQAVGARPASTREQVMTEGQANAAGFADRMKQNEQAIRGFDASGAADISTALGGLMPREFQSDARKSYDTAKSNWIAATLRKESGAAIGKEEYANADVQYFPQRGDGPAQIEQKRQLRQTAEQAMRRASGTGAAAAGAGGGDADQTGGAPPRMTRTIRNPTTGETRKQTSLDGGSTWN